MLTLRALFPDTLVSLFSLCLLLLVFVACFASLGAYVYGGKMQVQPSRSNLFLGALVWVWGPELPDSIMRQYPGVPARVKTIDLTRHPHRPLGVDLLTSFGYHCTIYMCITCIRIYVHHTHTHACVFVCLCVCVCVCVCVIYICTGMERRWSDTSGCPCLISSRELAH